MRTIHETRLFASLLRSDARCPLTPETGRFADPIYINQPVSWMLTIYGNARSAPKAVRMTWMQRLRRVFAIEIETCQRCGGKLEVIASIEDAELIGRILEHRAQHGDDDLRGTPFAPRAPPQPLLF